MVRRCIEEPSIAVWRLRPRVRAALALICCAISADGDAIGFDAPGCLLSTSLTAIGSSGSWPTAPWAAAGGSSGSWRELQCIWQHDVLENLLESSPNARQISSAELSGTYVLISPDCQRK